MTMPSANAGHGDLLFRDRVLRIGTRASQLALWQTNHVAGLLQAAWPQVRCELRPVVTQGDRRLDQPLPEIGGKGLFTAELEQALLAGEIDLAVHSLKDLPVEDAPGLTVGAILTRADVRDVLIARERWTLATLPRAAVVGTSSLRRQAQLAAVRPDLEIRPIRGNVDTRIRKVLNGDYHATVMAAAGVSRLGLLEHVTEWLDLDLMLPAPGQGALAVQCRAADAATLALLARLDDAAVRAAVTAERQLLWRLGGGCSAPVAALATGDVGALYLAARVVSVDGRRVFNAAADGSDPHALAATVARMLLAQGAGEVLDATRRPTQTALPLAGKRVLVTRAADQSAELAALLQAAGAQPLLLPTVQTAPLSLPHTTAPIPGHYDWIVFTSANAVRYFFAQYPDLVTWLTKRPGRPAIAAVGPATQRTLTARGIAVDAVPDVSTAAALPAALGDVQGARILLPRSAIADASLPAALVELGAAVDELPVYTTVTAAPDAATVDALVAGGPVDAVTFASPSAVRGFDALLQAEPRLATLIAHAMLVCIGPTTAAALAAAGRTAHATATDHSAQGLVDALIAAVNPFHTDYRGELA